MLHNFCERNSVYINEKTSKNSVGTIKSRWHSIQKSIYCVEGEGEVIWKTLTDFIKENIEIFTFYRISFTYGTCI